MDAIQKSKEDAVAKARSELSAFHLAYLKSVEFFHPGVFVEMVRLQYGLDYDEGD